VHDPSTANKFEASLTYQASNDGFGVVVLILPPSTEERLLTVDKAPVRIGLKGGDSRVEDVLRVGERDKEGQMG
jgi:hypothetical protein